MFRNTSKERMVTTISQAQIDHLIPQKGDSYIVGKIINKFSNRISIRGAVYRPGEYELKDSMSLLQLINEADGLREDVFISRGIIHRLKKDLSPEIIAFDIQELLNDPSKDIILKKEDQVNIYSKFDLREGYYVRIDGEVSNPGIFLYEEGMTAQDLVMMAGGFTESASKKRVEISRRVKDTAQSISNSKMALIYQQDINADLRDTTSAIASFSLSPFDEIAIHPAPGYFIQKNVVAEGEVAYTGKYTLETKSDRISDLVKRAGGLTPEAYIEGAVLVRAKHFTKTEQANNDAGINSLLKQNYVNGSTPELLQNELKNVTMKKSEAIGIDLKKIMANPHSEYDLFLNDGDSLRIPKQLQTVRVSGEVLYPTLERYSGKNKLKDYITGAGGFSDKASKRKVYVVYANGSVKGTKSFLFFRNYPSVKPGCDIYIPMRRERERVRTIEIVSIVATLAALLNIGYNIIRK
ncbi:MAG: SLBB domain-containing protein [Sphingobacteriales bacterium]|nr:SLBB domain-containing protein [Sphingobacteriales bacterium]